MMGRSLEEIIEYIRKWVFRVESQSFCPEIVT